MKSTPLLRLLVPLCVGIGVGDFAFPWIFPHETLLLLLCGVLLVASCFALLRHQAGVWLTLMPAALMFSLGVFLLVHQQRERMLPYSEQALTFRGIVTEVPHRTPHGWRVRLRMQSPTEGERWQVFLTDSTALPHKVTPQPSASQQLHTPKNTLPQSQSNHARKMPPQPQSGTPLRQLPTTAPQIGQIMLAHGRITALCSQEGRVKDSYSAHLLRQNIVATTHCFPDEWKIMGNSAHTSSSSPQSLTLRERLLLQRERWTALYQRQLPPHTAAVLSAMTLAHREQLDRDTQMRYSQGGASHILALSGLHLSILFGAFTLIFGTMARRWGRRVHTLVLALGLLLMWSFAALVGFPISLVRATLMLTLAQVFAWGNHRPSALHGLVLAMILLLLYAPDWLFDVGFQLSCAAVAGILLFAPIFTVPQWLQPLNKRAAELINRRPTSRSVRCFMAIGRYFYLLFTVSLSAQLATAPLVAYHFHQLPWAGIFSSLFVIPAAYIVLCGGILFLLIAPLRSLLAPVLSSLITMMEQGLAFFSQNSFAPIPLCPSALTTALSIGALLTLLWFFSTQKSSARSFARTTFLATCCLLVPLLSYQVDRFRARPQASIQFYPTFGVTTLQITSPDGTAWLLASDTLRAQAALQQTAHDDWQPQGLRVQWIPLSILNETHSSVNTPSLAAPSTSPITQSADGNSSPLFAPHCIIYGKQRIAIVDDPLSRAFPQHPLPVDFLVVGRNVHRPLAHLLCYFRPRQLVLSAAMTDFYRRQYTTDAHRLQLPCYDLQEQPTFTIKL